MINKTKLDGLKHSYSEPNGRGGQMTFTACCECERGGNGNAEHKCSSGGYSTEWDKLGCWVGEPMAETTVSDFAGHQSMDNRCMYCNFEIDSGEQYCYLCMSNFDEPLQIKLTERGLKVVTSGR